MIVMNPHTMLSALLLLSLTLYLTWPSTRARRAVARAAAQELHISRLAAGRCPVCDGRPFEQILMNGLTGCLDCRSQGTARAYRAGRR